MSQLQEYFSGGKKVDSDHPLVRLLESRRAKGDEARLEIRRPRAALGFEPAMMYLHFLNGDGEVEDYKTEQWDPELNQSLIQRHVRAIDENSEVTRFALGLAAALERPESRYGDGFFNGSLVAVIDDGPLSALPPIQVLRRHITSNRACADGQSFNDCTTMIRDALQDRWHELKDDLNYPADDADRVLAEALAAYLDERFTISDRKRLGWLAE
jgi:hypothetical protein